MFPLDRESWLRVCAKSVLATLSRYYSIRRRTHVSLQQTGTWAKLGQAGCTGDRREIDSYVGPLLANRIPAARRIVATAVAVAAAAGVPARARWIRIVRGVMQARKAYWFIGCWFWNISIIRKRVARWFHRRGRRSTRRVVSFPPFLAFPG